jgi:hypothetical protein
MGMRMREEKEKKREKNEMLTSARSDVFSTAIPSTVKCCCKSVQDLGICQVS